MKYKSLLSEDSAKFVRDLAKKADSGYEREFINNALTKLFEEAFKHGRASR